MKRLTLIHTVLMIAALSGCAQARKGIGSSAGAREEVWQAQPLCANSGSTQTLACMSVEPHITSNVAVIYVQDLGFDAGQIPYRILARRASDSSFSVLADNITTAAGGQFTVHPKSNTYIEEYQEWAVELSVTFDSTYNTTAASAGNGVTAADVIIKWPELNGT